MENTNSVALSKMMLLRRQMDVIANNISNASTAGYQGDQSLFVEHLMKTENGDQISYVEDMGIVRDISEGPLTHTGNDTDLAIRGRGYFVVETANGLRYTRNGRFTLNVDGEVVTARGDRLLDDRNKPLRIESDAQFITISRDGTVSTEFGTAGTLQVVRFDNPQELRKIGGNLYQTDAPALPAEDVVVVQGAIENANVKPVIEMTRMIETLRAYESAQRLMDTERDLQQQAIDTLASVN